MECKACGTWFVNGANDEICLSCKTRLKKMGLDLPYARLRELVEADRDGRCVVLPCKPSDVTIYQLRSKKHARGLGVSPRHVGCATVWAGGHYQLEHQGDEPCRDRDFGKTWFLTPEAAEAALKGAQHG